MTSTHCKLSSLLLHGTLSTTATKTTIHALLQLCGSTLPPYPTPSYLPQLSPNVIKQLHSLLHTSKNISWKAIDHRHISSLRKCEHKNNTPAFSGNGSAVVTLCRQGQLEDALNSFKLKPDLAGATILIQSSIKHQNNFNLCYLIYRTLFDNGMVPDLCVITALLNACHRVGQFDKVPTIWDDMAKHSIEPDTTCFHLFSSASQKMGSGTLAIKLFDLLKQPMKQHCLDGSVCLQLVFALLSASNLPIAIQVLDFTVSKGIQPSKDIFSTLLKKCSECMDLTFAKQVYIRLTQSNFSGDMFLQNAALNIFSKCGSLEETKEVFMNIKHQDVVTWTTMISAYTNANLPKEAIELFFQMQQSQIQPTNVTWLCVFAACADLKDKDIAKKLHQLYLCGNVVFDVRIHNTIIKAFADCGNIEDATAVFVQMPQRSNITWGIMILANVQHKCNQKAVDLFLQIQRHGLQLDKFLCLAALAACSEPAFLEVGTQIHKLCLQNNIMDIQLQTALLKMYSDCGSVESAAKIFSTMNRKDLIACTTLMSAFAKFGQPREAVELFQCMCERQMKPDHFVYATLLKACSELTDATHGKQIHDHIISNKVHLDEQLQTSVFAMYVKCGLLQHAQALFSQMDQQNVQLWNLLISAYLNRELKLAVDIYFLMLKGGPPPNEKSFLLIAAACAALKDLRLAHQIFSQIVKQGLLSNPTLQNAIISMFSKCEDVDTAVTIFQNSTQDLESWNALLAVYAHHGYANEAVEALHTMEDNKILPDTQSHLLTLKACTQGLALQLGEQVWAKCEDKSIQLQTTLISMYSKCGDLHSAYQFFCSMPTRDTIAWNAIIGAHALHGNTDKALELYQQMQEAGVPPDETTLVCLLNACSHSQLVETAMQYINSLRQFGVVLTTPILNCLVDVLARAGHIVEAEKYIINNLQLATNVTWKTLLGGCLKFGVWQSAEVAAQHALRFNPLDGSVYVLLSNTYAAAGLHEQARKTRSELSHKGVKRIAGRTWITTANNIVHKFVVDDKSHPQSAQIYKELAKMMDEVRKSGYIPFDKWIHDHDSDSNSVDDVECGHAEKLAIAWGFLDLPLNTPITVGTNLQVCHDCHVMTQWISKVRNRLIIVRDASRIHHFDNGSCSCG